MARDQRRGRPAPRPRRVRVLSNVPFQQVDVDHVVLTPTGCYAVEVKSLLGHREPLDTTWGLAGKTRQTADGARKIRLLLHSKKIDIPVLPLLVLAGPGAPDLPGTGVDRDGVRIVAYRETSTWLPRIAAQPATPNLDIDTARRAADALQTFTAQRHHHDAKPHSHRHGHTRRGLAPAERPPPRPSPRRADNPPNS